MIIDDKVKHIQKSSVSFKFKLFLLFKLPMGFLCGMRIKELNNESCQVTVPYKWLNKNPFKSTFWAVLGMAAEMNGAALLLQYTQGQKPQSQPILFHAKPNSLKKQRILPLLHVMME